MRRLNLKVFAVIALLSMLVLQGCTPSPNGDPKEPATLPKAALDAVEEHLDDDYVLSHWLDAGNGWYLVEITFVPTGEHGYGWVSKTGKETDLFGFTERITFVGVKDDTYRFLCRIVGDSFGVFPYYLACKPGENPEKAAFFKVPGEDDYEMSLSGLAYELAEVEAEPSLDLLFSITGPEPGGVMAGGARPPAAGIIESGNSVTMRFSYVTVDSTSMDFIRSFSSDFAQLKNATCENGLLELEFEVSGAYSVSLLSMEAGEGSSEVGAITGYRLSFIKKPAVPDASTPYWTE